ncbi:GntR family transcriptional regulator [Streptomyces sp. NPDC004436]
MVERYKDTRGKAVGIAAGMRELIMSGEWEPGLQLPTTDDLIAQHETSNVTVQRALNILKAEGFLEGRKGQGVFVRNRATLKIAPASFMAPSEAGEPYRWSTEATKRSQRGGNQILQVAPVVPPRRVRSVLGLSDDGTAILRSRLGLLDDEPAELVHSYYPQELAQGTRLADRRKIPGGSPTLLAEMGYPPIEQEDEISARPATTQEQQHLRLPGDVPVLEIFRVVYSNDRRPIEVTVLTKPSHLYKMGYHLPVH